MIQLNPIELYAMRFVEETGGSWTAEQLRAAEAEIEQQKREWEANRLAAIKKEEDEEKRAADEDEMLTYSREDAQNQVNNNKFSKRNPINRRLLKVKQNDRHGIVKNKRIKGRLATRQPIRRVAQRVLSPRRALRNNSKPNVNSVVQNRSTSVRISSRLNKPSKRTEDSHVSSDDEPLVHPSKNNGIEGNHAKSIKMEVDATNERSECSDQRHSEDFDDSECSLDVMVDSTDPQESDEESAGADDDDDNDDDDEDDDDDDGNESTLVRSDGSVISFNDTDTDAAKENSLLNSTMKNSLETNHQIDINSPRSTRSHGRIKINLWTLDESQKLPELCAKRSHNKMMNSKNSSTMNDSDICNENGNGSSADDCDNSVNDDNDNNASSPKQINTQDTKTMKQSKISDCFTKSRMSSGTSSSTSSHEQPIAIEHLHMRKSLPAKAIKIENPNNTKSPTNSINAKNHSSIDINRTPKVVLNKRDCEIQQQKTRLKTKISN